MVKDLISKLKTAPVLDAMAKPKRSVEHLKQYQFKPKKKRKQSVQDYLA